MLYVKSISNAVRSISALVSNHINALVAGTNTIGAELNTLSLISTNSASDSSVRNISTSRSITGYLSQASRAVKTQKFDVNSLENNINLPEKPKKPKTAWLAFVADRKDDVLRQKGKMTAAELAVILAREWKEIDRTSYQQKFDIMQQEYRRKVKDYEDSLTKEQRQLLELKKEFKREDRTKKLLKKTKPPVLPRNPANLYCHVRSKDSDIKEQMKLKKPAQVLSDIFREYRELPDYEKQRYIEMQEKDRSRFQHEFAIWYESIQTDETLTRAALDKADTLRDRFKALNYI